MGAKPDRLRFPYVSFMTGDCLQGTNSGAIDAETTVAAGFLSLVRNLELSGAISDGPSGLARVLRAAPRLQALIAAHMAGDFLFAATPPEGFAKLVHPRLRSIHVWSLEEWQNIPADGIARLRRLYFPRLRRLIFDEGSADIYEDG
jgi:hypothetical protein